MSLALSRSSPAADDWLTRGVIVRRIGAWLIDLGIIGPLVFGLWLVLFAAGLLTLGLTMPVLGVLPLVPFLYHWLFLASPLSATPGQALLDLIVRRNDDLGRPLLLQAAFSVILFYLTLACGAVWLAVAFLTVRRRTLHDLLSGLVVVRRQGFARGR